jgi:hypothetical protein
MRSQKKAIDGKLTAKTRRARRCAKKSNQIDISSRTFALFASSRLYLFVVVALLTAAADSPGVPFYYASATPLDQQIRMLVVGVNDSVGQAIVSRDRKHATLNVDPSLLGSAEIRGFTYQKGGLGFVGSAAPSPARPAAGNGLTPSIAASPSELAPPLSILDKPGMILIAPLER